MFKKLGTHASVIQTLIKQGEKEDNWTRAMDLFQRALEHKPRLVVFPEAFATGINFIILRNMAEAVPDGDLCCRLRELARENRLFIAAGILELGEDDKIYDCAVILDPRGDLVAKYRRRFRWVGECNYLSPGRKSVVVDTEIGRIGLIIGYDLCLPETCSTFLADEVDMILCPSAVFRELAFNTRHLAMARAMDYHCYFLYANALGFHQFANMHYPGDSAIFADPYFLQVQMSLEQGVDLGCLTQRVKGEAVLPGVLHLEDLAKARKKKLPFKEDASRLPRAEAAPQSLETGRLPC